MSSDRVEDLKKSRRKLGEEEKRRAEEIVREADDCSAAGFPADSADSTEQPPPEQPPGDLEARVRKSENKRLLLAEALRESREMIRKLAPYPKNEEDRALPFGVFVEAGPSPDTVIIKHHGRLYEAGIVVGESAENLEKPGDGTFHAIRNKQGEERSARKEFRKGELLLLNNNLQVIEPRGFGLVCGSLGAVAQVLDAEKLLVKTYGDESIVVTRAHPLMNLQILAGDNIEYDPDSLFGYSLLPKTSVDRLVLEKVPDIGYGDVGGLDEAIEQIREAIELPHLYPEYFREHRLLPPKGILLYGPPGCGKTLIAKCVAGNLVRRIEEMTGERGRSYFLNVKGPELLNKYVGETEQAIRDLFARARNQAGYRTPVIIFFDEMDSLFRIRGSGVSSDMEATIVPQFLAELDGLETLEFVVIIGATNRVDLIDPAVLRPGRLDRKIRIPRPDEKAAKEIFSKYLTPDLPLAEALVDSVGGPDEAVRRLIDRVVEQMYAQKPGNELLEVTYADGSRHVLYLRDFSSGAIIANIVNRAKFQAVKNLIERGERGIAEEHLMTALEKEYEEGEELPGSADPAEWRRIIGKGGEKVIRVRSLFDKRKSGPSGRPGANARSS